MFQCNKHCETKIHYFVLQSGFSCIEILNISVLNEYAEKKQEQRSKQTTHPSLCVFLGMVCWLNGWMDGWLNGWFVGWFVGWLNEWMGDWLVGWLVG